MAQNPGTGGCLFQLGGPMSCMPMIWPLRASTTRIKKQCISWRIKKGKDSTSSATFEGFQWISPRKTPCFGVQTIETGLNQEKFEPQKTTLEDVQWMFDLQWIFDFTQKKTRSDHSIHSTYVVFGAFRPLRQGLTGDAVDCSLPFFAGELSRQWFFLFQLSKFIGWKCMFSS